jgi:deoxyribodipyrimidine photo-lyase
MNLFIFHRDLRIEDNLGLIELSKYGKVVCLFVFTPSQIKTNQYFSENGFQFMCESLLELRQAIRDKGGELYFQYGEQMEVVRKICSSHKVDRIGFNLDYTPYARRRDEELVDFCLSKKIEVIAGEDYLLAPMGTFLKKDGTPYLVYGPFKDNALKHHIEKPDHTSRISFEKVLSGLGSYTPEFNKNENLVVKGGRKAGIQHLHFNRYEHNLLKHRTTELSAYIKFGCVSIREAYAANSNLVYHQQLLWREFFFYIGCYIPDILDKGRGFKPKYDSIKWNHNASWLKAWQQGRTGFPIIDACMRQLNTSGYMHNRGRLISANFLNRILGINWREGERYFATQLVDYDPLVNNGNWQWIASTGTDTKPYSQRLFNPWIQGERYDKDCEYIKEWLHELRDIPAKHLHQWDVYCKEYDLNKIRYFAPIVDYKERREISLKMYREI